MSRDIPLAEITLRKYEKPYQADQRELVKKVCLSLGLLQPGDSRDVIIDILLVLNNAGKEKRKLTSVQIAEEVEKARKAGKLELKGIAESNIRRQLKRLRDLMIIDKAENLYNLSEFSNLSEIFESKIEKFLVSQTIDRIKEYLVELDKQE